MNSLLKTIVMLVIVLRVSAIGYINAEEACTKYVAGAKNYINVPYKGISSQEYDMVNSFENGNELGSGSYGVVKTASQKIFIDGAKINPVEPLIKKIKLENFFAIEVFLMEHFSKKGVCPEFYGCVYDTKHAYIMMAKAGVSFKDKTVLKQIGGMIPSEKIKLYKMIIEKLAILWESEGTFKGKKWNGGFVHNDLKLANIVAPAGDIYSLKLIDFGLANKKTSARLSRGTPLYMSPDKFKKSRTYAPKDDLYALAISIGLMETNHNDVLVWGFRDFETYKLGPILNKCLIGYHRDCHASYVQNIEQILEKANYGAYQYEFTKKSYEERLKSIDSINFTTFITWMVEYDDFDLTYEEVIFVMNILIGKYMAEEKIKSDELKYKLLPTEKNKPTQIRSIIKREIQDLLNNTDEISNFKEKLIKDIEVKKRYIYKKSKAELNRFEYEEILLLRIEDFLNRGGENPFIDIFETILTNLEDDKKNKNSPKRIIFKQGTQLELANQLIQKVDSPYFNNDYILEMIEIDGWNTENDSNLDINSSMEKSKSYSEDFKIESKLNRKITEDYQKKTKPRPFMKALDDLEILDRIAINKNKQTLGEKPLKDLLNKHKLNLGINKKNSQNKVRRLERKNKIIHSKGLFQQGNFQPKEIEAIQFKKVLV